MPRRESASFWSRRTGFAGITTMIGGVALGKLVDLLGREESTTYIVVLLIGILFGCLSTFVFAGAADPDPAPRPGTSFLTLVSETWHNREYRLLTGFFSYQSLFAWLSTGFIFVYLQAEDGMNFSMMTIQIMLAVSALVAFLSGYFFRVVGSKYGRKPVLVLCSVLKGVEFILWGILLPLNGILDEIGIWIVDRTAALWGGGPAGLPPGSLRRAAGLSARRLREHGHRLVAVVAADLARQQAHSEHGDRALLFGRRALRRPDRFGLGISL